MSKEEIKLNMKKFLIQHLVKQLIKYEPTNLFLSPEQIEILREFTKEEFDLLNKEAEAIVIMNKLTEVK